MPRAHRIVSCALALALALGGCSQTAPSPIDGKWTVDIEATLANASRAGARDQDLPRVRKTYEGGTLAFDDGTLVIGLEDGEQTLSTKYTVVEAKGDCVDLALEMDPRPQRFCVRDGRLESNDVGTPLVVVYKRS
jgi:hypothetical protein